MDHFSDVAFQIIQHGGNARSSAMEAISFAKQGKFIEARQALHQSASGLAKAHQIQTGLIQQEAAGQKAEATLLLIHASRSPHECHDH